MDFEDALIFMKEGKKVRRKGWVVYYSIEKTLFCNGKPSEGDYFMGNDILATDWEVVE